MILTDDAWERRLAKGRVRLLFLITLTILVSAVTIGAMWHYVGMQKAPQQIVRFGLTCLLMWHVWRGGPIARRLAVVLFFLGGLLAAFVVVSTKAPMVFVVVKSMISVAYLPMAAGLALPNPVRDFVLTQQARYHG